MSSNNITFPNPFLQCCLCCCCCWRGVHKRRVVRGWQIIRRDVSFLFPRHEPYNGLCTGNIISMAKNEKWNVLWTTRVSHNEKLKGVSVARMIKMSDTIKWIKKCSGLQCSVILLVAGCSSIKWYCRRKWDVIDTYFVGVHCSYIALVLRN